MTHDHPKQGREEPDAAVEAIDFDAVREALDTLFATGDPEEAFQDVSPGTIRAYLQGSERARSYFDQLARVDRALDGARGPGDVDGEAQALFESFVSESGSTESNPTGSNAAAHDPADFERAFGDAAFSAALDDMLAEERAESCGESATPDPQNRQQPSDGGADIISLFGGSAAGPIGVAVAAMAALALGVVLWNDTSRPGGAPGPTGPAEADDGFQARSAVSADHSELRAPELEVFCVRRSSEGVSFRGTRDTPNQRLQCPLDAEIKLAYRNFEPELRYAAFFGVGRDGTLYWYGPSPATRSAKPVDVRPEMQPFGETIRLEVNHRKGATRVHAVFASEPIDFGTLKARVDATPADELFHSEALDIRGLRTASTSTVIDIAGPRDGSQR